MTRWLPKVPTALTSLWTYGVVLVASGIGILIGATYWAGATWLSVLGGGVTATGLTILTTAITSKRAVHEQYAKEANLDRKRTVYGPLHSELKALNDVLAAAQSGEQPFPQWIDCGAPYPVLGFTTPSIPPTFLQWPAFKRDYRADNFRSTGQSLLDRLLDAISAYNTAILTLRDPVRALLTPHLAAAIDTTASSAAYDHWLEVVSGGSREKQDVRRDSAPPSTNDWFYRLLFAPPDLGSVWANAWINAWPVGGQPTTLGWLLARRPQHAADVIFSGLKTMDMATIPPPAAWIETIFNELWRDLEVSRTFEEFWKREAELVLLAQQAEQLLAHALLHIRDQYEGGEPPI